MRSQERIKTSVRLKARWLPVFVLIFAVIQQLYPSKVWMSISTVFAGVWAASFIWASSLRQGLRLIRKHRYGWSQVGDVFEEQILLQNQSLLPALWLFIQDSSTLIGHSISLGTGIGGLTSRKWIKRTVCQKRGEYQLGPTMLVTGDIFGFYEVKIVNQETNSFFVSPPIISLPVELQTATGKTIHDRRSTHRNTEASNVSVSTREYVVGDSLKRIHWMITAKKDKLHVRQFENIHSSNSCWVVLDLNADVHRNDRDADSVENCVIFAVSLANRLLFNGLGVGLLAHGENGLLILPPGNSRGHLRQIQRSLATIQAGEVPLDHLLRRTWRQLGNEHALAVVTPSREQSWLDQLSYLRKRKAEAGLFLLQTPGETAEELMRFGHQVERGGLNQTPVFLSMFDTQEIAPGKQGVTNWRFTPMGRAIKVAADQEINQA